jgi:hypothetical protein
MLPKGWSAGCLNPQPAAGDSGGEAWDQPRSVLGSVLLGNTFSRLRLEIYGLPIAGIASQSALPMEAAKKAQRHVWYPLVLVFASLSLGIVVGGIFYYRHASDAILIP